MSESLAKFLLEKREENKDEMEKGLKQKYIGDVGELFALNYLENLFKRNNIRNYKILPHNDYHDEYDLDIYINGRNYKIEIKTSTNEAQPHFHNIHFNNDFDFLLLIWKSPNDKIYLAILSKKEAREIATPINTNREDEDNWVIHRIDIFDEDNKEFLNRLSMFLELKKELEDLEDNEKIELLNASEEEIMKNPDAVKNDFSGEVYQQWIYQYLSNYVDEVELMPREYKYDIKYKGKGIEIKYSLLSDRGAFNFKKIKPNLFHFIFLIGFDDEENKFYFSIKTSDEIVEIKKELAGSDEFSSQNGFELNVGKHNSKLNFVNDFYFEDFDKYIETH